MANDSMVYKTFGIMFALVGGIILFNKGWIIGPIIIVIGLGLFLYFMIKDRRGY